MNELLNQAFNKIDLVVKVLSVDVTGMDKKPLKDIALLASQCKDVGYLFDQYVLSKCSHETLVPEVYEGQHKKVQTCAACGAQRDWHEVTGCGEYGSWLPWRMI